MTLKGVTTPRQFTQPLRELTPETSLGFDVIRFATDVCYQTLMPWQEWWLIHALELLPNGEFRFRQILTLISRQNGKTHILKILALYFMVNADRSDYLVLGVAQDLTTARESWQGAIDLSERHPDLMAMRQDKHAIRRSTGDIHFRLDNGARYKITAANGSAGRGLSVDLLILDELREHRTDDAWAALSATTIARSNGIIVAITNAGDARSVVLNLLRDSALAGADERVGIFEWSAPDGCDLDDRKGWAQANPGLGYTIKEETLASLLTTTSPDKFRTEHLCQYVTILDGAIDLEAWQTCADSAQTLNSLRDRVVLCVDVAPDNSHVSLVAAALGNDGRVRVEPVRAWDSTQEARQDLPALIERIAPMKVGYFQNALAPDMQKVARSEQIKSSDLAPISVGFAELVTSRQIIHGNDPLLNRHVNSAQRMRSGEQWKFCRSHSQAVIDCLYAAAGAAHLARNAAPSKGKPRIILAA